jgi:hypothetical protein
LILTEQSDKDDSHQRQVTMNSLPRYTIRGLLIITTAIACVFGLARWLDNQGGLIVAIPVSVLPLSFVIEWILSGPSLSPPRVASSSYVWRYPVIVAAAFFTAAAAWLATSAGIPTLTSPLPLLVVLPLILGIPWVGVMAIPIVTFLMLNMYLGRTAILHRIPYRFPILLLIATGFTIWWFAVSLRSSYEHQGAVYANAMTIINSSSILALWAVWFFIQSRATFWSTLWWSLYFHCWLFWYAFPWLGELL